MDLGIAASVEPNESNQGDSEMRMVETTELLSEKSIDSLFTLIDELNFVKEALTALQDRLTDEEFLSTRNSKQLVRIVTSEGLQMAFFLKRFDALIEVAGEINRNSKAANSVH